MQGSCGSYSLNGRQLQVLVQTLPVHQLCVLLLQPGLEITVDQNLILQFCHLLLQRAHLIRAQRVSLTPECT